MITGILSWWRDLAKDMAYRVTFGHGIIVKLSKREIQTSVNQKHESCTNIGSNTESRMQRGIGLKIPTRANFQCQLFRCRLDRLLFLRGNQSRFRFQEFFLSIALGFSLMKKLLVSLDIITDLTLSELSARFGRNPTAVFMRREKLGE